MHRPTISDPNPDCVFRPSNSPLRFILSGLPLLAALALFPDTAQAACEMGAITPDCVSRTFTASVGSVVDPTGLFGVVGPTVSGSVSYDAAIVDAEPGVDMGEYPEAIECATISAGDFTFELALGEGDGSGSSVFVNNDITNGGAGFIDSVIGTIVATALADDVIAGAGGFQYAYSDLCILVLGNCPVTLVTNDAFPPAPGATIPSSDQFFVEFVDSGSGATATILGDLASLSDSAPIACPESGGLPSLAAGLLWLGVLCRGQRINRRA